MIRKLITVVLVSGLSFSVFIFGGSLSEQVDAAADGGIVPNRDCVCPVRLDPDFATDAGLKTYQRAKFPCALVVLPDAGRDVTLPPMPAQRVRQALDVVKWDDCTIDPSTAPVRALWGTSRPFTTEGVVRPWCRAATGLPCMRAWPDGGVSTFGLGNIYPCAQAAVPATCERVSSGNIILGDDEADL